MTPDASNPAVVTPRVIVLDTSVLMHDPAAIFRFHEHHVHLPMVVLEELDAGKKGMSEPARNARQASRFLDQLMHGADRARIEAGVPLPTGSRGDDNGNGRLFVDAAPGEQRLPEPLRSERPDNTILATALSLMSANGAPVTLVSKDINLRIKAAVLGLHAEDYYDDKSLDDADLLITGAEELDSAFWDSHGKEMDSWKEEGRTYYRVSGPRLKHWHPNIFLYGAGDESFEARVISIEDEFALIGLTDDYRSENASVWGISARNREQNFALNLLLDPEIEFVTVLGAAGTGKTLLTLAAGLTQTLERNLYREIIMTRVTVPLGEDIGFLPGTEEEKMEPWMGALMDNLEVLTQSADGDDWGRAATNDLLRSRIKIRSLNFMRGRTFVDRFIIIDEAQNLTSKQMKALITRAGPGSKMICLGNIAQIDTPYLTETTSGLTYVVDRFKAWPHAGHVTLMRGERSRLADFASEIL